MCKLKFPNVLCCVSKEAVIRQAGPGCRFILCPHTMSAHSQLWCAVGVNLSGGKTRDGGSIIGASVFYSDVSGSESENQKPRSESQSSLDKLEQELKVQSTLCLRCCFVILS